MSPRRSVLRGRGSVAIAVLAMLAGCERSLTVSHDSLDVALAILANPWVAGMLLWVGLLGLYVELKVPGFGVPGLIGIAAMALLFGSQYAVGHASPLEILLFVVGLILIVVEVAVIPGFGVVGVAGIACTLIGLVLALQSGSWPDLRLPGARAAMLEALFSISLGFLGFLGAIALIARFFPSVPLLNRLVQTGELAASVASPDDVALLGHSGRALSDLRPAGKVAIGDRILDASTSGGYVEAGARVRVTRVDGNRMIVETESSS